MNSKQLIDTKRVGQGAIVVGIYRRPLGHIAPNFDDQCSYEGKYLSRYQPHPKEICELDLDELSALLLTLNIPTAHRVIQERNRTGGAYFLGRGKLEEITELAQQSCAGLIAVDGSLSGSQMRAMERLSGCQVIDR